jgi:hypothetical protein
LALTILALMLLGSIAATLGILSLRNMLALAAGHAIYGVDSDMRFSGYRWARITLLVCSLVAFTLPITVIWAFLHAVSGMDSQARIVGWLTAGALSIGIAAQSVAVATLFTRSARAWFQMKWRGPEHPKTG